MRIRPLAFSALALLAACGGHAGTSDAGVCGASCIASFRASWMSVPGCFSHATFCSADAGTPVCQGTSANDADCTWADGDHASVTYTTAGAGNWDYAFDSAAGPCLTVAAGRFHVCAGSAYTFGTDGGTFVVETHCAHTITCPDGTTLPLPSQCLSDLPSIATGGGSGATCANFEIGPTGP